MQKVSIREPEEPVVAASIRDMMTADMGVRFDGQRTALPVLSDGARGGTLSKLEEYLTMAVQLALDNVLIRKGGIIEEG